MWPQKEVWAAENAILFGKYQLCRVIGTGRTCTVYLAVHTGLEEYRAIKKISRDSADYKEFHKEAVILKNIRFPGIPVIYDLEEDDKYYYLIEEYLEGISLLELVREEGTLSKAMTVSIGIQICHLVNYLHSAKPNPILYLDLQPKNLLLCHDTVKLVDFGQAVFLKEAGNLKKRYGTVGYAAPEQYTDGILDERTDIYAIGQIMHFLYTGISAEKGGKNIRKGFLPFSLTRIINKCLETEQDKRYPSVNILCNELEKIREDGKENSHLSSLTIAFTGSKPGVGTTHLAIGLSQYLTIHGFSNLYEEKNLSNAVRVMAEYFCAHFDRAGMVRIKGSYMKPLYGSAVKFQEPEGRIRIQDYGAASEGVYPEADVLVVVKGGKWWDINTCGFCQEGNFIIYNLPAADIRVKKEKRNKQVDKAVYMKAPYFESPFSISLEAEYFYKSLMERIWRGMDRRSRKCLLKRWTKEAWHIIRLVFAGS